MAKHILCTLATGKRWSRSCSEPVALRQEACKQPTHRSTVSLGCLSCMLCTRTRTHMKAWCLLLATVCCTAHCSL